jgi:hypothetical protein
MTTSYRERALKAMFFLALLALAIASFYLLSRASFDAATLAKAGALFQDSWALYAQLLFIAFCVLYALVMLGIIAFRAARSASLEIFFFSLWCLALCFELARAMSLWMALSGAGLSAVSIVERFAIFGRYLSFIALFMGSMFPAGLKIERSGVLLSAALIAAMFFTSIHPINQGTNGSLLVVELGYARLLRLLEIGLALLTIANYGIAWKENRDKAFLRAGLGAGLCIAGVWLGRSSLSLILSATAIAGLCLGSWLYLKSLYAYYLWR